MKIIDYKALKKDLLVAIHFLQSANNISKSYLPLIIIASIFKAITPFFNIVIPKFIIDELMGQKRIETFIILVSIVVIGNGVFNIINRFFDTKIDIANMALINGFELNLGKHIMNMDFESLEDPEILNKKEQALFPIKNQGVMQRMVNSIISLIQSTITIVGLIALISTLNIMIVAVIILVVLLNSFIYKKIQKEQFKFHQSLTPLNRKFIYYMMTASDFSMAKDVRVYNMSPYMLKKISKFEKQSLNEFNKTFKKLGECEGLSSINLQIQMIFIYSYLVWKVFIGMISIGDFTMFTAACNKFSNSMSEFLNKFIEFRQMCKYLDLYLEFERLPSKSKKGTKLIDNKENVTIEFKNVYFRYPRSDDYTLQNVSIKINSGEKLSVVGENGAGKTTFIKLLCRLYEPEKGEILVNGINIKEYKLNEYMDLLAVVFQDYKIFSFSVKENLIFNKEEDEKQLIAALEKSGVYDKIKALDKGINTSLYKNFEEDGIELSGGENQKIAIARAIYKNAPIVILDEPTAALDPYAEYEIYSKFNELVEGKTAIYISHRLSSCLMSDKIAVFDNGELIEYGNHTELKNLGGKYSKLWNAQAQYYVDAV